MALVYTWPVGQAADKTWPVGQAADKQAAPLGPPMAYFAGTVAGGLSVGALLGLAGNALAASSSLAADIALIVAVLVGLLAISLEWRGRLAPLPERRRQVPRAWLLWRKPRRTAFAFGLMIGFGALTHIRHATAYMVAVLAFLAPSVAAAGAIGAIYGCGRGSSLLSTWAGYRRAAQELELSDDITQRRLLAAVALLTLVAMLIVNQSI